MFKVPLSVFVISTSKNASLLSCSSSLVNLMFLVVLSIVCKKSFVFSFLIAANTSSTYLSHVLMSLLFVTALLSRSCITASARKLESATPLECQIFVGSNCFGNRIQWKGISLVSQACLVCSVVSLFATKCC